MLSDRKLSGDQIVSVVSTVFGEDRAGSLKFRFDNEKILSDKARQKMIVGRMGTKPCLTNGERIFRSPTVWIITFGAQGAVGAISLTVFMLLPVLSSCYVIRLVCGVTAKWHLLLLWQCFSFVHGGLSSECHDQPHLHAHVGALQASAKPDKNQ